MAGNRAQTAPQALHLRRLSAAAPEQAVALPGGRARSLSLSAPQEGHADGGLYVCLEGRLLLDLPHGDFVQLRAGAAHHVQPGIQHTLTPVGTALLLIIADQG